MESMWIIWLVLAGFFFICEMITAGFLVFWLGVGALVAMVFSFLGVNLYIQIIVFVVLSIVLIILTKPIVKKFIDKEMISTNTYSIIGKKGIVVEDIEPLRGRGQVKVDGEIWSAKTETEQAVTKDTEVKILKIEGVKLIVQPCKKEINV